MLIYILESISIYECSAAQITTYADVATDALHGSPIGGVGERARAVVSRGARSGLSASPKVVEGHGISATHERERPSIITKFAGSGTSAILTIGGFRSQAAAPK